MPLNQYFICQIYPQIDCFIEKLQKVYKSLHAKKVLSTMFNNKYCVCKCKFGDHKVVICATNTFM